MAGLEKNNNSILSLNLVLSSITLPSVTSLPSLIAFFSHNLPQKECTTSWSQLLSIVCTGLVSEIILQKTIVEILYFGQKMQGRGVFRAKAGGAGAELHEI